MAKPFQYRCHIQNCRWSARRSGFHISSLSRDTSKELEVEKKWSSRCLDLGKLFDPERMATSTAVAWQRSQPSANGPGLFHGYVLLQVGPDGKLHPVAYGGRKTNGAELNYPVHEKELLAVKEALRTWAPYLQNNTTTTIITNHQWTQTLP